MSVEFTKFTTLPTSVTKMLLHMLLYSSTPEQIRVCSLCQSLRISSRLLR